MRILYYDCFAGISGDMNIGAMIDLGVDTTYLNNELAKLNVDGFRLDIKKEERRGISGIMASVIVDNPENMKHRHLSHIKVIINDSALSDNIKKKALKIFQLIAEAEAKVHNIDIQKVHFHEVGALDSIVDIVGAAICLEYLKVDKVLCSPIQLGGGTVKCAHGIMPVPAPATALILENIPVKTGLVQQEATTPTGAAILAATVNEFTSSFDATIIKTAHGIGQRDVSEVPNVLRLHLLEVKGEEKADLKENSCVLACNIDDMNPEHYEFLLEKLFNEGASDVWFTPIIMKKSRPATMISVLCILDEMEIFKSILFKYTTTLGIREKRVTKNMLRRKERIIETIYGKLRIKESFLNDERVRYKPEYEDCKKLALQHNVSISEIESAVHKKMYNEL